MSTVAAIGSGGMCDIAVDSDDNIHISFLEDRNLRYLTNGSGAWTVATLDLHSDADIGIFSNTSIAIDGDGHRFV